MNRHCQKLQSSEAQRGSAALDFILVAIPLLILMLAQVSLFSSAFVLNILRDTAVEGARFASLADQTSDQGCARAKTLFEAALGKTLSPVYDCQSMYLAETALERVSITVSWLGFGLFTSTGTLRAESVAPRESVN